MSNQEDHSGGTNGHGGYNGARIGLPSSGSHTERFEAILSKVDCPAWLKDGLPGTAATASSRQPRQSKRPRYQENRSSLQNYSTLGGGGTATISSSTTARRSTSKEFSSSTGGYYYRTSNWSTATLNDTASSINEGGGAETVAAAGGQGPPAGATTPNGSIDSCPMTERLWVKKPYLGWRSTDNLQNDAESSNPVLLVTPNERLARRYHHPATQQRSASSSRISSSSFEGGGGFDRPRSTALREFPHFGVHDSIRSVTSAILDYCENDDANGASKDEITRPKMVWKESSFLSAKHGTRV